MPASLEVARPRASAVAPLRVPRFPVGRILRALVLAVVLAGLVLLGRSSGWLNGIAGLLVASLLVLAVPTSRDLCRRILLAGCLLLGWTQVLWWAPLPVGDLGRVTCGLVVLAGALGAWVGWAEQPGRRALRLLPRLRLVDLLVPATVGLGILAMRPWLQVKTSTQTLGLLLGGWDNVAHFSMVHTIRRVGVTVDLVAPPSASTTWQFAGYPQGFHTAAAAVLEILIGPGDADLSTELIAYSRALALLVIAATTMVVAGFCALPALRGRPGWAAPVAAFVSSVIFWGPGSLAVDGGIGNFVTACCLVIAVVLLVVPMARVVAPLTLAAIGGALVGVATSWVLLLFLAAPAVLVLVLPLRRARWSTSGPRAGVSACLVVVVLGCIARTAVVLSRVQAASPLTIDGGRVPVDVGVVVAATIAILGVCTLLLRGPQARVASVAAVPLAGVATAAVLVVLQVRANGEITYYGLKFLLGVEIVLLPVLIIPLVHLLHRRARSHRPVTVSGVVASVLVAAALTQVFGLTVSRFGPIGFDAEAEGARDSAKEMQVIAAPPAAADLAARVERSDLRVPAAGAFYLDLPPDGRVSTVLTAQWFLALTDTWTSAANDVAASTVVKNLPQAEVVARRILETHPGALVVVRDQDVDALRRAMGQPQLASRIVGL